MTHSITPEMKEAFKSNIKKGILRLKEQNDRYSELYKLGIDLINYEKPVSNCLEESLALMCATTEELFEHSLDILQWWLYEGIPDKKLYSATTGKEKRIEDHEVVADLNNIDDFVDYLTQYL